jgi:hypothetical protein
MENVSDDPPEQGALKFSDDGKTLLVYDDGKWKPNCGQLQQPDQPGVEFRDGRP